MRYELDENGYISKVFFGCHSGTCTLYEGEVPVGYDTLEEWATTANIRAYKIVEGNLAYDETRAAELELEFANCTSINAMTISLSANTAHTVTSSYTGVKVNLNQIRTQIGSKLTFEDNSIKIGAGVRYVRISANAMMQGIANHQFVEIRHNDVNVASGYYRATAANYYGAIGLTPQVREVTEGDKIFLNCGAGTAGTLTIASGAFTYLTVEVIE